MKKTIIVFCMGLALGATLVGTYSYFDALNQAKVERNTSEILTKLALVQGIREKFGDDYIQKDGYNTLFTVKDEAVVIVERDGVKTLRAFNPSPKN